MFDIENKNPNCSPMLYGAIDYSKRKIIIKELESLYNRLGIDNEMGTPDYLLAEYTLNCLIAYGNAMNMNKEKGYIKSIFEEQQQKQNIMGDYEQKHKETRERVKKLDTSKMPLDLRRSIGEQISHELAESEDEKIRKEIKKDAEAWYKEHYEGSNPQGRSIVIGAYIDGALAWLEKQGEHDKNSDWQRIQVYCFAKIHYVYGR